MRGRAPHGLRRAAFRVTPVALLLLVSVGTAGCSAHTRRAAAALRLVWADDFNGPAGAPPSPRDWTLDVGPYGAEDGELETYTASTANAALDGHGHLAITALPLQPPMPAPGATRYYTSARLDSAGRFSVQYGLIEARMKVPPGAGLWPAFWMLGDDIQTVGWPGCGEIDVMEVFGDPDVVNGTLHGPSTDSSSGYAAGHQFASSRSLADRFHVYGVEWRPGSISWLIDGRAYASTRLHDLPGGASVFDHPFHLLLDLAVGGQPVGHPAAASVPARLLVDWVRVYELPGTTPRRR